MEIIPIPCLLDNYAWLLLLEGGSDCAVVDPSEAEPVAQVLKERGLQLRAILNTHHHYDHVGGNEALLEQWPGIPVYGHSSDNGRIPGQTVGLDDGGSFSLGKHSVTAMHVPGHTTGAVAYVVDGAVFTGDTLFAAGCGRLFEGTPAMMHHSLVQRLGTLPGETRVYCGHEYTVNNLLFAAKMEPHNTAVADALAEARTARSEGRATLPSTMAREHATNPFLRSDQARLRAAVGVDGSPVQVFAALRHAKDHFKG